MFKMAAQDSEVNSEVKHKQKSESPESEENKWSTGKISHLIELLEGYPCLYDTKNSKYHDRDARAKSTKEMATALMMPEKEVTKKIKNLCTQYGREYRKFKKRPTGTGTSEVYENKWLKNYSF